MVQQMQRVPPNQRRGRDHFGIQQHLIGQAAVKHPAMPIGPIHHRRDGQTRCVQSPFFYWFFNHMHRVSRGRISGQNITIGLVHPLGRSKTTYVLRQNCRRQDDLLKANTQMAQRSINHISL
jgi:hypothetical protein